MDDLSQASEDRKAILKAYLKVQKELDEMKDLNQELKSQNAELSKELEEKSSAFQNLLSFIQSNSD